MPPGRFGTVAVVPVTQDPFDFSGYTAGLPTQSTGRPESRPAPGGFADPFAVTGGPTPAPVGRDQGLGLGPEIPADPLHAERPPVGWLGGAGGAAFVGGAIAAALGGSIVFALLGWALSGPAAIGLLALFTQRDTRARATPIYLTTSWVRPVYWVVLVLIVLAIGVSAWRIAEWAGRL